MQMIIEKPILQLVDVTDLAADGMCPVIINPVSKIFLWLNFLLIIDN